jgi:cell division protein ZapB
MGNQDSAEFAAYYDIFNRQLTLSGRRSIVNAMEKDSVQQMAEQELKRLEFRLDELIQTVERLKEENRSLRAQQQSLTSERAQLVERNEMARSRVEAMISRLKAMEQST